MIFPSHSLGKYDNLGTRVVNIVCHGYKCNILYLYSIRNKNDLTQWYFAKPQARKQNISEKHSRAKCDELFRFVTKDGHGRGVPIETMNMFTCPRFPGYVIKIGRGIPNGFRLFDRLGKWWLLCLNEIWLRIY